ncbi:hypothetical protein DES36_10219 [Alkalibaculum bacchi]|jgi:hypothetical protein|uniref:Uncharacterized protein n=1 Tax=Alkalibaculum bacchi TaxID=645887 RepID=A0A366IF23_9FIRM|nr:DUF6506 family protein [Alkalibaculum bacchi]RBP68881.1 hypothetical protein DES36_10219 [Alkalibaculum bacchi]
MSLKAAFIFIAPNADDVQHRSHIHTDEITLITVGVDSYASGIKAAKELVKQGVKIIELCGGFGHEGVTKISESIKGEAVVGVVRFDNHPGLDFKSGDEFFKE